MSLFGWFGRMPRALVPFLASVGYAIAASLAEGGSQGPGSAAVSALALGVAAQAAFAARTAKREKASGAPAFASWGFALVLGSTAGAATPGWGEAVGAAGALVVSMAALSALDAVDADGHGAGRPLRSPAGLVVRALLVLAWCVSIAAHSGYAVSVGWALSAWPLVTSATSAALGSLVLAFAVVQHATKRKLELGAIERLRAAGAALLISVALALGLALTAVWTGDRALRIGGALGALIVARLCVDSEPVKIARASRLAIVLAMGGGPLAILIGLFAMDRPLDAGVFAAVGCGAAVIFGAAAPALAASMRPAGGAWLDAAERAREALLRWDSEQSLSEALAALRVPVGPNGSSPQLWTFDPDRVLSIDGAGYSRVRSESLAPGLLDVAAREPLAILRAEVLDALEVRRPELRPLVSWMNERGALFAVVVTRGGEPEGLLLVPRGTRGETLSLEEARAFKSLADQLAAACHAESSRARARAREMALGKQLEAAEDAVARLSHAAHLEGARHARATSRLARAATVGIYSASARLAYDVLERRTRAGAPIVVIAPSGIDPVPYIARAHLAGTRSQSPLVLVDGTAAREHDVARWTDPASSPLALADGGVLVLLDGAALPSDVQLVVARALAEKRPPWERADALDIVPFLTVVEGPRAQLNVRDEPSERAIDGLEPALAARLGDAIDAAVRLPRLAERAEDIRAILTDRLAREGLRVLRSPVGIDDSAYGRLVEYSFPGDETELASMVERLVARCARLGIEGGEPARRVVTAADIDALGLPSVANVVVPDGTGSEASAAPSARGRHVRLV